MYYRYGGRKKEEGYSSWSTPTASEEEIQASLMALHSEGLDQLYWHEADSEVGLTDLGSVAVLRKDDHDANYELARKRGWLFGEAVTLSGLPRRPQPAYPPEIWSGKHFDPEEAWNATKAASLNPR